VELRRRLSGEDAAAGERRTAVGGLPPSLDARLGHERRRFSGWNKSLCSFALSVLRRIREVRETKTEYPVCCEMADSATFLSLCNLDCVD